MAETKQSKLTENATGSTVIQGPKVWGQAEYVGVDVSRWVVIYPPYIDSTRKQVDGRRLAKEQCVDNPNAGEIFKCVRRLGLRTQLEMDKLYCRDSWVRGRVRVELADAYGSLINASIPSRQALFMKVASMIPQFRTMNANVKPAASGHSKNATAGANAPAGTGAGAPAKKKKGKR